MTKLKSGLQAEVGDEEFLARFLVRGGGRYKNGTVKPAAFLPHPKDNKTSVFRHEPSAEAELKKVALEQFPSHVKVGGVVFIKAKDVRKTKLNVVSEEPPMRHADLVGWPLSYDGDMDIAKNNNLAQLLLKEAVDFKAY